MAKASGLPPARARRDLVRLTEACERYQISKSTVRRLIASGQLNAYRLGARIIAVDLDELEALFRPVNNGARS